jgi:hypothetical protein
MLLANQVASASRAKCDWRVFERGIAQTQSMKRWRLIAIVVAK